MNLFIIGLLFLVLSNQEDGWIATLLAIFAVISMIGALPSMISKVKNDR